MPLGVIGDRVFAWGPSSFDAGIKHLKALVACMTASALAGGSEGSVDKPVTDHAGMSARISR